MALVATNSKECVPKVFVAKVLRQSKDRKIAYLAEFVKSGPERFQLGTGKHLERSGECSKVLF